MAAKRPRSEDSYDDVMTCPVCTNEFMDPRLLSCGHHFCCACLVKIAQANSGGSIRCPTCRHITREKTKDLKKYKFNEFQTKASLFMDKKRAKVDKPCKICKKSTPATSTCRECQIYFCNGCRKKHETFENISDHKVSSISEVQFCVEHPDNFVQCICTTCDKFLCSVCGVLHDKTHSLEDIKSAAGLTKERLNKIILNTESLDKDKILLQNVKDSIVKLQENEKSMNRDISDLEKNLVSLLDKVRAVKKNMDQTSAAEIKELRILEQDVSDFINTKEKLIQHSREMLDNASDCDIITQGREFPQYASDSVRSVFTKMSFETPKFEELKTLVDEIKSIEERIRVEFERLPIILKEEPLRPMKLFTSFKTCTGIVNGLAYNPNNDTYVVRSNNAEKLIQVYDTLGNIVNTFGSNKDKINRDGHLAIDTRRKLYLLPTADGKIVTIDYDGREQKVIDVTKFRLTGIAHCTIPKTSKDRYIVSSACYTGDKEEESQSVYIVDPEKGTVLTEIKKDKNTSHPYSVTGFCTEGDVYVTAGYYNGGITLFDLDGKKRIDIKKSHNGEDLKRIVNVSSNFSSGILVGERFNNSILSYRYNKNKETLYDAKVLFCIDDMKEEKPDLENLHAMAYDWKKRQILVRFTGVGDKVFVLKEH